MKKLTSIVLLILFLIIPQLGCNSQPSNDNAGVKKSTFMLDTVCTVTVYAMDGMEDKTDEEREKEALLLITDVFGLCGEYEKTLSRTIEGSDVYRLNHAVGQWVDVQPCTAELIEKGQKLGELSGGAFDITIGGVSSLWDFHGEDENGERTGTLPDEKAIAEAVSHVDYRRIEVDGNRARLLDEKAQIDLGGIAKGYIADRAAEYLRENGVTSAVLDLGGNIEVIGEKAESMTKAAGQPFSIGIASPDTDGGGLVGIVPCRDKTVVTSGTYERYFEIDGKRYHHVLDTRTGYPVDTDLLSATVIGQAGASADCDGLSTVCLALGSEKARQLIENTDGVGAVLVALDGTVTTINVPEFEEGQP